MKCDLVSQKPFTLSFELEMTTIYAKSESLLEHIDLYFVRRKNYYFLLQFQISFTSKSTGMQIKRWNAVVVDEMFLYRKIYQFLEGRCVNFKK